MKKQSEITKILTKALSDAGAKLLLGTDTPNPFLVPGYSIYEEIKALGDAGLSPYQALRMGTWNAAKFVDALDEFGTVSEGKRADLILLESNPLEEINNIADQAGVMVRGLWFPKVEINEMLEKLVKSYEPPEDFFKDQGSLPTEGDREFASQYRITYNDIVGGEERFAIDKIADRTRMIISQRVFLIDKSTWTSKIIIDNDSKILSLKVEVKQKEELIATLNAEPDETGLQITRSTSSEGWIETKQVVPTDTVFLSSLLATDVILVERLKVLKEG